MPAVAPRWADEGPRPHGRSPRRGAPRPATSWREPASWVRPDRYPARTGPPTKTSEWHRSVKAEPRVRGPPRGASRGRDRRPGTPRLSGAGGWSRGWWLRGPRPFGGCPGVPLRPVSYRTPDVRPGREGAFPVAVGHGPAAPCLRPLRSGGGRLRGPPPRLTRRQPSATMAYRECPCAPCRGPSRLPSVVLPGGRPLGVTSCALPFLGSALRSIERRGVLPLSRRFVSTGRPFGPGTSARV